ncbi:RIO kinase 1 [soil metagenome]
MSTRSSRRFDDDNYQVPTHIRASESAPDDPDDETGLSTYVDAAHGPSPTPDWVITSATAIDVDLGVMKSGKEADVSLLRRCDESRDGLMAVKRYRDSKHRLFHRDAGYLEGRRVEGKDARRSREQRAMATRSRFGLELIAGQWASAEFSVLSRLWQMGAAVPYPVQLIGTELMMEFIGDPDGTAAPRLAQLRPDRRETEHLFQQLREVLQVLAEIGYAHADLSPYNILVHANRLVLIDVPQAIDLVGNPHGFEFLRRDCVNVCTWFEARGIHADVEDLYNTLLRTVPHA